MKVNCPNIYCYHHGIEYMCNCKITDRQNITKTYISNDDRVNYSNRCEKRRLYEENHS